MPEFLAPGYGEPIQYATEEETLEFVNKFREAGGGDLLEGLKPARPENVYECLIAKALNFSGAVIPIERLSDETGEEIWHVELNDFDIARLIAENLNLEWSGTGSIRLPQLIGNVAHAFDEAPDGWTLKYREED